ncbi:hypothetical protein GCM10010911_17010 [Paenibacillus nasutitermitis]|uniref:histidine kinase n=1 Tax=Paenibacillus nasutitermitis TaxID=1652958 RepID=A0A916YTM6_9BACL|nr:hypothetical protein GCM10010911_17010 [Paenibacillus nasutitermitis]
MRKWTSLTEHSLPLKGEWEFYPLAFMYQNGVRTADTPSPGGPIQVPGKWRFDERLYGNENFGFGTYRLNIQVDPRQGKSFGIHIPTIKSSSEVYINGQLLGHSGQPAKSKELYTPLDIPYTSYFTLEDQSEIEVVIQVSNFANLRSGGIVHSIKFGLEEPLRKDLVISGNMVWVACIAYAIHVLYGIIVYLMGGRDKRLLYFSLMVMCIILATLLDGERLLYTWVPFTFEWSLKVIYLGMLSGGYFLYQLISDKLPLLLRRWFSRIYHLLGAVAVISVLLLPLAVVQQMEGLYFVLMFIPCTITIAYMYKSAAGIDLDNIFLLLAAVAAINSLVWLIIINTFGIEMIAYPFDLIVAMICFSSFWFKRYFRMSEESRTVAVTLMQADKAKDDFLSTVAHELRNPLHGMINISQSLFEREQGKLGINSVNDLKLLAEVGRRMSYTLNDLLDMARLRENRISLNLSAASVHGAASSVIDMLRFMTEGKPIQLNNRIPVHFPLVHADEYRLNQIMFNLLHNAVKYSHAGEVSVQAEVMDGWASISVADTGIGIESDMLVRLFEPYEQASSDPISRNSGLGLGLSICRKLVEMHGGVLSVRSQPDEGTVFTFTLKLIPGRDIGEFAAPLTAAAEMAASDYAGAATTMKTPSEKPAPHSSPDRIRLLAVDDDPVNLNVLRTIFTDEIYEVSTAISGKEALKLLEQGRWDLIISDVIMPLMSGYELTARIRERYSLAELPVLLLTASSREEDIEAGFRAGANDYVTKPVHATELMSRVRSLTNLKKSVNERLRMEAALLQAQIKPHFVINTFTALSALSRIDTEKMDALIEELTQYFRLGIDFRNSDRAVPLERELKLVRSYLYIQKERFEDRLQVVWDVDDEVDLYLPPLTIQPLVDNAVIHGIMKRSTGGEIQVRVTNLERSVEIQVSDNGVGMDEKTIRHVLDRQMETHSGIGLLNTHRRLMQFCGSGLRIESKPGVGTTVSFTIAKAELLS